MKALITQLLTLAPGFTPLALRIPIGIILMAHGAQKLFGRFRGYEFRLALLAVTLS